MAAIEPINQVTVITVTCNSAHYLPTLGKALAQFPHVIVVDNGSDDDCAKQTPAYLPQAQALALPANLGIGAANNWALAQVQTPFALLLNPDCEITPQAVTQLLHTAAQWPDAAMVAPQLLWHSRSSAVTEGPACVGFVCGAAMLLRMSAYRGQFFDEQFFLYYEDDDLCTRLFNQRQAMIVDPTATATHRSRGSERGLSPLRSEYLRGYPRTGSTASSKQIGQTSCGCRTSPTSAPDRAGNTWPL